jgi:hypothetical protein
MAALGVNEPEDAVQELHKGQRTATPTQDLRGLLEPDARMTGMSGSEGALVQ